MSFTSIGFVLFLVIVFALYYIVPKRAQWVVLLVSSYIFYMFSDVRAMVFLVFTTVITFYTARLIGNTNKKCTDTLANGETLSKEQRNALKNSCKKKNKAILAVGLIAVFAILVFLKYYNFAIENINLLLGLTPLDLSIPSINLLLPLGISFYIFQSTGYVIDVYRGKYPPDCNIAKFALFVSFFPQIIQGPIARYDQLGNQLYAQHKFDYTSIKYSIQLILWGLFKKMVIADRVAALVNTVFTKYTNYGGAVIFTGVLFYCIQIYCDFSGGIDIARGVAEGLGIELEQNFKRPYFAKSVSEFWRRWHITLGAWMKDYLFYPLSLSKAFSKMGKPARKIFGNRVGKILPASLVTFVTFTVIGLWHGASWKYIAFGFYNGGIITASMLLAPFFESNLKKLHIRSKSTAWGIFCIVRTFILMCIGRYFSRATSFMSSLRMLKRTFIQPNFSQLFDGTLTKLGLGITDFVIVFISVLILFYVSFIQEKGQKVRHELENKNAAFQVAVMLAAIIIVVFLGIYREGYIASQFIYAQF